MAHISTVEDIWKRAKSLLGLREASIQGRWVTYPDEPVEWLDDLQTLMATKVPEKLAGVWRLIYSTGTLLGGTGYGLTVKKYTLPTSPYCLQIYNVSIQLPGTSEQRQCDLRNSDEIVKLNPTTQNPYDAPTETTPWAIQIGRELWFSPINSTSAHTIKLDMTQQPEALVNENSDVTAHPSLRILMPHYVASKIAKKKRMMEESIAEMTEFKAGWLDITGLEWTESREFHTAHPDQVDKEGKS